MTVRVQREDFDVAEELAGLTAGRFGIGGVVSFLGLVRDAADGESVLAITLEHYPGMTERQLSAIEAEANHRWPLLASLVIHRHGRLEPGERIVLVAVASAHREAAFAACQFIVDWLKTRAPFWKCEHRRDGDHWVEAKSADDDAAERWSDA